ncbi:hypothetical protein MLD38_022095 [Melastoma candidum]|uniref:Uncharacterized protein n=1 Tax=Melastoma candidum TaxID=119954 RepID=A0ACB9QLK2_9MYRT|nr:hypothetical protein MLD38_022095 [Melastoma candidum]
MSMVVLSSIFLSVPCASHSDLSATEILCSYSGFRHRLFVGEPSTGRIRCTRRFVVSSTHSNPRILKGNRKSRFGQSLSPYGSGDGDSDYDDEDEEDADDGDDWLDDDEDEFAEPAEYGSGKNKHTKNKMIKTTDESKGLKGWRSSLEDFERDSHGGKGILHARNERKYPFRSDRGLSSAGQGKGKKRESGKQRYPRLSDDIELDERWIPLLDYLCTFGLKESHFLQMYERHMPSLQINVCSAKERLDYLLSIGVKQRDVKRILLRQPQILEYTVESNLKSHVSFLMGLGIPNSRIGQIIAVCPSLFSYSVEKSLKPTVRYLVEEVGIKEKDLGKVVQLSPQILVQRIDISWNTRFFFLSKEIGAPRDDVVKMVTKHPQLLHYSIDDGLLPRINFLRSIGMRNSDILKVLTSLTQVLSLSLEENLKPKYMYLIKELQNEVQSLTKYPTYLSLSLEQRIRPRHRFLVALKKAPKGPFPLSSFVPTDESFCQQWAGTSLDKYLAFRQRLLLNEVSKKCEK